MRRQPVFRIDCLASEISQHLPIMRSERLLQATHASFYSPVYVVTTHKASKYSDHPRGLRCLVGGKGLCGARNMIFDF